MRYLNRICTDLIVILLSFYKLISDTRIAKKLSIMWVGHFSARVVLESATLKNTF